MKNNLPPGVSVYDEHINPSIEPLMRVKRLRGSTAQARFLAQCEDAGQIPRRADIPSPYAYSPEHNVLRYGNKRVILVETAHQRFDVFDVSDM